MVNARTHALAVSLLLVAPSAAADPSTADKALAETLYRDAQALMEKKDYAAACPKLAESQRLDPAGPTLMNLALCHEAEGKTASAWVVFQEVQALARRRNKADVAALAQKHIDALLPRLSKLTVVVTDGSVAGLEVRRDGTLLPQAAWGTAMPLDPGEHRVEAAAPGRRPFAVTVTIGKDADARTVTVPSLEAVAPPPPSVASAPPPPPATTSAPPPPATSVVAQPARTPTWAWVAGGVGAAALVGGTAFALASRSNARAAKDACPDPDHCPDRAAVDDSKTAVRQGNVATVLTGVGLVGVGVFAWAWATTPRTTAEVGPSVGPRSAGLTLRATFR